MRSTYFIKHLKQMRITPSYIFLATLYGLSTLIIPFAVQILVNNLALAGLWTSTFAYLSSIALALIAAMTVKYFQLILVEFMQRQIFFKEVARWQRRTPEERIDSPYFFEIFSLMKTFSTLLTEGVDLFLRILFGGLALIFIHPAFIALHLLLFVSVLILRWQGRKAIESSVIESDSKYRIYYEIERNNWDQNSVLVADYLFKRDVHFGYVRLQAINVNLTFVILQIMQLAWGIYLVQANQLSIGNLVSAEIILSGILLSYSNTPKLLEAFYDFETSCIKIASLRKRRS